MEYQTCPKEKGLIPRDMCCVVSDTLIRVSFSESHGNIIFL